MKAVLLLAAAALVAAGCVSPPEGVAPVATPGLDPGKLPHFELSDAHDHKDRASHNVSWNMEYLGWDPVAPDVTKLGRYNHVNVVGDLAFVTAYTLANGSAPGLAVLDVSGRDPVLLSTLDTPDITPIDVHVSSDAKYAVLAGHRDNRFDPPLGQAPSDVCTGTPNVNLCGAFVPGGVHLVDVSDPAAPAIVDTWMDPPSGAHTAKVELRGGTYYVYIASYGFSYANRLASAVDILELRSTPLGLKLVPIAKFAASEPSGNNGVTSVFVHDMFVQEHPDGRHLMYVSYWDGGVVIADVSDPARPSEVVAWKDFDAATYGNVHFARPVGVIGERHVTMAAPEFGSADHAGEMYVLDTTDPASPQLLGKWTLPGDPVNDENYRFSPHNFDPMGSRVVYAHYHGGVWVIDLAVPEAPVVQGYVFPTVPDTVPDFDALEDAPRIWAAVWTPRGTIVSSDVGVGIFHHALVSEAPGAAPYEAELAAMQGG